MEEAPCPADEAQRLQALFDYHVLDTPEESAFDQLTELAANILDVPIALVSLIDENRQWSKSHRGLDSRETPRSLAFCSHAILHDELFEIPDARLDPRFSDNPLVTKEPHVIFYAGVPLRAPDDYRLGTLCAIDNKPRQMDDKQRAALLTLAEQVMTQLELRKNIRVKNELFASQAKLIKRIHQKNVELNEFAYRTSHDLKSPLLNIRGLTEFIQRDAAKGNDNEVISNAEKISILTYNLENLVSDILDLAQADSTEIENESFDIESLVEEVAQQYQHMLKSQNIEFVKNINVDEALVGPKTRYQQIISNLLSNSIKYADSKKPEKFVEINIQSDSEFITLSVTDNGLGIDKSHQEIIFKPFKRFHSNTAFGSGLGLSIVEKHVQKLHGNISVKSDENGTTIEIRFPNE